MTAAITTALILAAAIYLFGAFAVWATLVSIFSTLALIGVWAIIGEGR